MAATYTGHLPISVSLTTRAYDLRPEEYSPTHQKELCKIKLDLCVQGAQTYMFISASHL